MTGELGVDDRLERRTTAELVASRPSDTEREADRLPVIVVLDNVRSAHNVGLVFRLCDCVNVQELWLSGITAYPGVTERATRRIAKTAVGGSLEVLPWRAFDDCAPALARRRADGWRVAVLEQTAGSAPWTALPVAEPTVFVFGHERDGVRRALLELADTVVELPARGVTNSLNVALCAAAVLYRTLDGWQDSNRVPAGAACR